MTLSKQYNNLDHRPHPPESKEWILLKDVCKKIDKIEEAMKLQGVSNQIIVKMFELIRKEPMYGPMLEDEE